MVTVRTKLAAKALLQIMSVMMSENNLLEGKQGARRLHSAEKENKSDLELALCRGMQLADLING